MRQNKHAHWDVLTLADSPADCQHRESMYCHKIVHSHRVNFPFTDWKYILGERHRGRATCQHQS